MARSTYPWRTPAPGLDWRRRSPRQNTIRALQRPDRRIAADGDFGPGD